MSSSNPAFCVQGRFADEVFCEVFDCSRTRVATDAYVLFGVGRRTDRSEAQAASESPPSLSPPPRSDVVMVEISSFPSEGRRM
ncbi:jg21139 [Pararge aegeria aegeria]|uniref:Jg21139 protein n=1 Tax=Pararge aegeria aegeria TaxID=348720 RepID=A0A8S4SMJ3_9NEOP|nr:jg21139 [Pararge aegeria aegeria]